MNECVIGFSNFGFPFLCLCVVVLSWMILVSSYCRRRSRTGVTSSVDDRPPVPSNSSSVDFNEFSHDTATKKVDSDGLGLQKSLLNLNIGDSSVAAHRNGSWLRSVENLQFLSHFHEKPLPVVVSRHGNPTLDGTPHQALENRIFLKPSKLHFPDPPMNRFARGHNHISSHSLITRHHHNVTPGSITVPTDRNNQIIQPPKGNFRHVGDHEIRESRMRWRMDNNRKKIHFSQQFFKVVESCLKSVGGKCGSVFAVIMVTSLTLNVIFIIVYVFQLT